MLTNKAGHALILNNIIKDIYGDRFLAPILGFKGETACCLLYNLPRFSVDLDFNLLDVAKAQKVLQKCKKILHKYGIVKESLIKKNTVFLLLSYEKKARNIKVEISTRDYGNDYEIVNYFGLPVLTMKKENMFAHKLIAMSNRRRVANRDLFDIHFFLENHWPINEKIITNITSRSLKQHLKHLIKFIQTKIPDQRILQGLGEVLDQRQKIWAKEKLKKETLFLLQVYLTNL